MCDISPIFHLAEKHPICDSVNILFQKWGVLHEALFVISLLLFVIPVKIFVYDINPNTNQNQ